MPLSVSRMRIALIKAHVTMRLVIATADFLAKIVHSSNKVRKETSGSGLTANIEWRGYILGGQFSVQSVIFILF